MEEKEIVIIVMSEGKDYDISDTQLILDYKREKYIPDIDKLLDWRSWLMKAEPSNYWEKYEVKREILATDYLLNLK